MFFWDNTNYLTMRNIAVLLAGGTGKRMGGPEPKQFIMVKGKSLLEHSIRAFASNEGVDAIVIVAHADYIERIREIAAPYEKVMAVVPGGKERYDSSIAAIKAASGKYETSGKSDICGKSKESGDSESINLLIHDAVRAMVSQRIITDCITALKDYEAVDVAIPCTDTIIEVDAEGRISHITPRSALRNVQTPQCFRLNVIKEAYARGLVDPNFVTTDDCGVVHRYMPEVPILVVAGDTTNIKVTYPEDLILAEKILS